MSYTHLTPMERAKIELFIAQGWSYTAIAVELGRHRTTISREYRRNKSASAYRAETAEERYKARRQACRPKGRLNHEPLRDYVEVKIAVEKMSPELVAGRLRIDFPEDPRMRVCHETIYQAIYSNRHYLDYLWEFLTQARPKRRKRGQGKTRRGPIIPNRVSIAERPAAVEHRVETGHWEGDLIVGKGQNSFILTLLERASRILHAVKLTTKRAAEVCHAVVEALLDRPASWIKTITFDNGTEFAAHNIITEQLGARIYFADPYAAYQRGSNEQVNGLIRRYLPKGTCFKQLPEEKLQEIVDELNNRPKKCLGYRTPNEVFLQKRKIAWRALRT